MGPPELAVLSSITALCLVAQSCLTLRPQGLSPTRPLCPWGLSRQEYWSGLPCPSPGDLLCPGIEPRSPALQVDSLPSAAAAAKSLQSCLTLCDPIDGSPPGSSIPGILQARILEGVAVAFSDACMHAKSLQSCPTLCDPMVSSPPGSSVHRML